MTEYETETARSPKRDASPFPAAVSIVVGAGAGVAIWAVVAAAIRYLF